MAESSHLDRVHVTPPEESLLNILSHSTIEEWANVATDEYNMYPKNVLDMKKLLGQNNAEDLTDELYPEPELVTSISTLQRFQEKEIRIITRLHSGFLLARTFCPDDEAIFIVLDETRAGHIVHEFSWDLECYWSSFGFRASAGFWPALPQFSWCVNCKGTSVVIVGPPEWPNENLPKTKILDCTSWTTKVMDLAGIPRTPLLWIVNMEFDPREKSTDTLTMICSPTPQPRYDPSLSLCVKASLLQYSTSHEHVTIIKQNAVRSGFLQYLKNGQQFMCLLNREGADFKILGIFNSDTTDILFIIDLGRFHLSTRWEYACTHLIPIYSACHRFLSVVLWMKNVKRDCITSDVVTFSLPYVGDMLPSLKHVCRAVIISHVFANAILTLPLPCRLLDYVTSGE